MEGRRKREEREERLNINDYKAGTTKKRHIAKSILFPKVAVKKKTRGRGRRIKKKTATMTHGRRGFGQVSAVRSPIEKTDVLRP